MDYTNLAQTLQIGKHDPLQTFSGTLRSVYCRFHYNTDVSSSDKDSAIYNCVKAEQASVVSDTFEH